MNVLITSVSNKIPLINAVRSALKRIDPDGILYGADNDPNAVGRYFVDMFWKVALLDELRINDFITYCSSHRVTKIIPTRNEDLLFFSCNQNLLNSADISVMVSGEKALRRTIDKLAFYQFGRNCGFPVILTSPRLDEVNADKFVVKERRGAGSKNLQVGITRTEVSKVLGTMNEPVIQPFLDGGEYSVDLYIDRQHAVKGVIARKRIAVRNGEAQITRLADEPEMEKLALQMALAYDLYGHVMFQILQNATGLHVIECNPRFGGASTLSVRAGLDSFYWFFAESEGNSLQKMAFKRSEKVLTQIRYPQDLIL